MRLDVSGRIERSIGLRLGAIVAAAVLSAVLIGTVASAWREADRRYRSTRVQVDGMAAAIAAAVSRPLAAGSKSDVTQTLVAIRQMPLISFAQVRGRDRRIVAQLGDSIILEQGGRKFLPNSDISLFSPLVLRNYVLDVPVVNGGKEIGSLRVIADISHLRGAFAESLLNALFAGLVATGLALLLARRLQRTITDPVRSLTDAMERIRRSQDYSAAVEKTSADETGLMVDAFNSMMAEIRERDRRLAEHRDHLEAEVEQRTRELKAATVAAQSANAAKSEFLATMSHEIRTPLNGMLVMAELLATGDLPLSLQRHADVIVSSGQSLVAIINDILDLSKIEAGRLELEKVPVSPRSVAEQVANLFSARAAGKGVDLVCTVAPSVPQKVLADPVRLNQVLANLVNNALKFTEAGHVALRIEAAGASPPSGRCRLRYSVEDTGIGIAKENLESIFEPFSQADQSTTRKFGGTGIGLTISRRLVDAMGGTLTVESEVGEGSCFHFSVEAEVVEPAPRCTTPGKARELVLIAAAASASRDALRGMVRDLGYETHVSERLPDGSLSHARLIFAEPDALGALHTARLDRPFTVLIAAVGDTAASRLIDEGLADATILRPLLASEISFLLEKATEGREPSAPKPAPEPAIAGNRGSPFRGLHVLAADDSPINREVLSEALARLGAGVMLVEDGLAAVEALRRQTFDLVFMDCSMPGLDGFAATRMIRDEEAERGASAVPVIALTAHVTGTDNDAWRRAGMNDYMTKPFTLKGLAECLERWALGPKHPPEAELAALEGREWVEAPVLNPMVLEDVRAMQNPGDGLVERIIGLYKSHAPAALTRIEAAADAEALAESSHAMKSLCRNIGAERLGHRLDEIERAARSGGDLCSAEDFVELRDGLSAVLAALEVYARETADGEAGGPARRSA